MIQPFEKKFGVKVIHDATGTASQDYAKIRAARGAPGFDVAGLLTPPEVMLGVKEGLLEKLTEREVPNLKHLWDKTWQVIPGGSGAPHTLQYAALVYNKDKLERPRSWADYWEPQKKYGDKIKGHVINYNPANLLSVYALIHAAQLGKGGVENMDPAWARLKAQKPYVGVVVTGSAEAVPHFENGQVWISPYWSARSGYYIDRGLPFEMVIPKEGVIGLLDVRRASRSARRTRSSPTSSSTCASTPRCSAPGRSPTSAARRGRRRAAGEVRRQPDRHAGADRQDPVPGLRDHRRAAQGLDLEVAGDHGAERRACLESVATPWLLVAAPMALAAGVLRRCRTRCCSRPASSSRRRSSSPAS